MEESVLDYQLKNQVGLHVESGWLKLKSLHSLCQFRTPPGARSSLAKLVKLVLALTTQRLCYYVPDLFQYEASLSLSPHSKIRFHPTSTALIVENVPSAELEDIKRITVLHNSTSQMA